MEILTLNGLNENLFLPNVPWIGWIELSLREISVFSSQRNCDKTTVIVVVSYQVKQICTVPLETQWLQRTSWSDTTRQDIRKLSTQSTQTRLHADTPTAVAPAALTCITSYMLGPPSFWNYLYSFCFMHVIPQTAKTKSLRNHGVDSNMNNIFISSILTYFYLV